MASKRLRKMVSSVVRVSGKHRSSSLDFEDTGSLIASGQPVSDSSNLPRVPKGFMAVYVGPEHRRFVIPTKVLSDPGFKALMDRAAEEYGYDQEGGLSVPCDEDDFRELLAAGKIRSGKCKSSSSYMHTRRHSFTTISV